MSRLRDRRHRRDRYHRQAKQRGFAARSVFKLEEIDLRFGLLRPGQHVLDLGCCPGSWLQYALERVGPQGLVVGVDRGPLPEETQRRLGQRPMVVIVADVLQIDHSALLAALPGTAGPTGFDVILSDMAPDTTGIAFTDQVRSAELFGKALDLATACGRPGASFVGKIFMGEGFDQALSRVKRRFARTKTVKPDATRRASTEVYVVAFELKPR